LSPLFSMTPYVQSTWRDVTALDRFYQLGEFKALVRHRLVEIRPGNCVVKPSQASSNQSYEVPADTVVMINHNEPSRGLFDELRDEVPAIYLIGDARSPRDVQVAIAEGHRLARELT